MDPLSEVLRSVRLSGGVFLDAHFSAPWCVASKITAQDCQPFLPSPAQIIAYHVVVDGRLTLEVEGDAPVEIKAGEIVLLPRNDAHVLASAPGLAPISADTLIQPAAEGRRARIVHGGGGQATHVVCGFLGTEDAHNPLIATLPRVLTLDVKEATSRDWIEASVRFAARELAEGRIAPSGVVSRLSELLLVEAVRAYLATLGEEAAGWLKGLKDPHVGRALALIHGQITAPWTTEGLAREAALSRSAFTERFTMAMGMPPIRYLNYCRLHAAKLRLVQSGGMIAQIAHAVGYESEAAFNRAFKREFGLPPARWRDRERQR
jgi:AraC-like DNA-binding protein